ncbi:hypothetical protein [Nocardiopsis suaedae]|uniref:Uncharacterized protein n=1 Tax=Nocardiopsis suaedae TaxID=3018444 RepID=A0ABT4TFE4_9ACTN|nr:hypothetical protein [Nocardiopsis suaedae]MDA2803399.1 hypothetical protein [Nocardiopsis suaedae]
MPPDDPVPLSDAGAATAAHVRSVLAVLQELDTHPDLPDTPPAAAFAPMEEPPGAAL